MRMRSQAIQPKAGKPEHIAVRAGVSGGGFLAALQRSVAAGLVVLVALHCAHALQTSPDHGAIPTDAEAEAGADEPSDHWCFRPVVRPALPRVSRGDWPRNPVDHFILARLDEARLTPAPQADRATLLRRLKFDLLGLPPTPEEVDAFVADTDPGAYERRVDHYLASPQFGERWARHWLDVVRFAESDGFEMNNPRPNSWPYRDYVIRAFNEDRPYDQFITEQLAGDVVGAAEATGFLVGGPCDKVKSPDPALTLQQRADELHDMVGTAGSAFLGLTVGCARCHNHKFDPISQRDYFGLVACLAGVRHGERPLPLGDPTERKKLARDLRGQAVAVATQLEALEPLAQPGGPMGRRLPVTPRKNVERFEPVRARFIRFVVLATNSLEPCLDELEVFTPGPDSRNVALASAGAKAGSSGNFPGAPQIHRLEHINDGRYGNGRSWISNETGKGWVQLELPEAVEIDRVVWGRDREGVYADRLPIRYRIEVAVERDAWKIVATSDDRASFGSAPPAAFNRLAEQLALLERRLVEMDRGPVAYAGVFAQPEPTHRLHRGDPMQKRELIVPAALSFFNAKLQLAQDGPERERRLALAKWITDPANPLTARVIVNRIWQHHFGEGIVSTPSDFGVNGARPTHPELLDWLASELVAGGWRLKRLHRLMVLSATYRQSSAANGVGLTRDADGRLLWRFPPRRLEAETMRDAILFVSGNLDLRMGGQGFDLFEPNSNYVHVYTPKTTFGPAEWRRMIYQAKPRMRLDDTFGAFDCPDAGQIAPRRNRSTTALQALNLLNSPFMIQQARLLAERIQREAGAEPGTQVRRAFRLTFQRDPSPHEMAGGVRLAQEHGLHALCRALLNANEFLYVY
jgi:hypothetical protein